MDLLSSNATYSMFIKLLNCTEGKDGRHFHNLGLCGSGGDCERHGDRLRA